MVVCPTRNQPVEFVLEGKIVMRGFVDCDGFEDGTAHQSHSCNDGEVRSHAEPQEFAWIKITEVGLSHEIRKTGQRTWAKMPSADV